MLQAYIDESGNGDHDMFVMGGYIATAESWNKFSQEWQELLTLDSKHYPTIDSFKMSRLKGSPEGLEMSRWFYRVIEKHAIAAISASVPVRDLVDAFDNFPWPKDLIVDEKLKNPVATAFPTIMMALAKNKERLGITEPVDFIFDERSDKVSLLTAWEHAMQIIPPEDKLLLGSHPIFFKDDKVFPLQAADLFVNWVRDWEIERINIGYSKELFPWKRNKDYDELPWMHFYGDKKEYIKAYEWLANRHSHSG